MNIQHLKQLAQTFGVSSAESQLHTYLQEEGKTYQQDGLGSLLTWIKSENPEAKTLMLACPLDEVGLMVQQVKEDGIHFISLEPLHQAALVNQRVQILTHQDQLIEGVIVSNENLLEKTSGELNLIIQSDQAEWVQPGDLVGFYPNFMETPKAYYSKALAVRLLNELMFSLAQESWQLPYHLVFAYVAQSTIGYRGSMTVTHKVQPDYALALTGFEHQLGQGMLMGLYDKQLVPDQKLRHQIEKHIQVQPHFGLLGNDGSFIHKSLAGIPTVSLGLPVQGLGTANEVILKEDAQAFKDGLCQLLRKLDLC